VHGAEQHRANGARRTRHATVDGGVDSIGGGAGSREAAAAKVKEAETQEMKMDRHKEVLT
jgi:hypothetical protein